MGRAGRSALPGIDPEGLARLEHHFVAQELYRRDDLTERQTRLARAVSGTLIPQLLRLHAEVVPEAPPVEHLIEALAPEAAPNAADVSALADIMLGNDLEAAVSYVLVLRDRGLSMERLFIELLEPTARQLGELWDNDECDFIDVTLGVARLQKLLASFNETHRLPALADRRQILMAMAPGDQHFFGASMVERFLRAAGWSVHAAFDSTPAQVGRAAHLQWFAVAALTMGSDKSIPALRDIIALIRAQSQNPDIGILVGGAPFTANPALVDEVGADATAINAPAAVLMAQKLFDAAASRPGAAALG